MRTHRLSLGLLVALMLAGVLAGCGGAGVSPASSGVGRRLTIYSSLPLQGPLGAISRQIIDGERLALSDAGGRVGSFVIDYRSLDDSTTTTGVTLVGAGGGEWDPGLTASNARVAARDPTTIAYLGEYDSGATAVSLPITNAAGILQVSPVSPYVGLTSSLDAGQDEPERFYPTAQRTFGRLAPGDPVQAAAQVALMRKLGIGRVYVLTDEDPFNAPLGQIVSEDARRAGIEVLGNDTLDVPAAEASFSGEVSKVVESEPQAVFFSGVDTLGAAHLFRQLHTADPLLRLLASSSTVNPAFISWLGPARGSTYLGTPALAPRLYPPSAQHVLDQYRRRFAGTPGPYVLYGYETMSVVLEAIRSAGSNGDERRAVIDRFFATRDRHSVLGTYSIQQTGESTLSRYGIDRISGEALTFWRSFNVSP